MSLENKTHDLLLVASILKKNIEIKSMANIIILKYSNLKYHKLMECFHQDIQPKVCPALSEVVLGHSTNQNSSLGQLFQRCWYSLHLRCQLQPTANFLQHFKNCVELIVIVSFSRCKFISKRLLCEFSNWDIGTPGGIRTAQGGTQNVKFY